MTKPKQIEIIERKIRLVINPEEDGNGGDFKILYSQRKRTGPIPVPEYAIPYQEVADLLSGKKEIIKIAYRFTSALEDFVKPVRSKPVLSAITERIFK